MAPAPIVALDRVTKRFASAAGPIAALDGISAGIAAGRITGLVGPDGAGKTTLLRLVAGLLKLDGGTLTVLGRDGVAGAAANQAEIGYMPQRFGLYEDLSVGENLRLHADLHRLSAAARSERVAELLHFTGLARFGDRLAGRLSGGMKQKLGLACSLIARPRLLLLDEPSVGVDPVSRRELWRIVEGLADDGVSVLWSTAYLDEAERCGEVLVLDRGRLIAEGEPQHFVEPLRGRTYLLTTPPEEKRATQHRLMRADGVIDSLIQGSRVRLVLADGAELPAMLKETATPTTPRFEDAFVARLKEAEGAVAPSGTTIAIRGGKSDGAAIETSRLVRRFGGFRAVDDVSFSVRRGEIFGLLGPNGAGKSTIFRMLCGLLPPSEGTARVAGIDLGRARAAARARLGYMAQRFSLYGELSVRQNLHFIGGAYQLGGRTLAARVAWALDTFELGTVAEVRSDALPLGYKQRLALAATLLHEPEILFLDEPTSGVDPLTRREFWGHIGELAEQGMTVLVTTHFMDEAEYCDRLAVIYRGKLIASGAPDALKEACADAAHPEPSLEDAFVRLIEDYDAKPGSGAEAA